MPYTYAEVVKMNIPMFSEYFSLKRKSMNPVLNLDSGISSQNSVCLDSTEISDSGSNLPDSSSTVSDSSSTISNSNSMLSNSSFNSSTTSLNSNSTFAENWANLENMEEFLEKAGQEESFQNNVKQVTKDWILIYSEISLKGIGSDVSRWICVNCRNEKFVYQRRPTARRRVSDEKATFYKSIVLDGEGKIVEVK